MHDVNEVLHSIFYQLRGAAKVGGPADRDFIKGVEFAQRIVADALDDQHLAMRDGEGVVPIWPKEDEDEDHPVAYIVEVDASVAMRLLDC